MNDEVCNIKSVYGKMQSMFIIFIKPFILESVENNIPSNPGENNVFVNKHSIEVISNLSYNV